MKKIIIFLMMFSLYHTCVSAAERIFFDDFNSYKIEESFLSGAVSWGDKGGNLTVSKRDDADNYLLIDGIGSKVSRAYGFAKNGKANTSVLYEWDFYQDSYANDQRIEINAQIFVDSVKAESKRTASIRTMNGKFQYIKYINGTVWEDLPIKAEYKEGEWYKFKLLVNYLNNTYTIYLDNELIAKDVPAYQLTQGTMAPSVKFYSNASGSFGIDNVRMSLVNINDVLFSDDFENYEEGYNLTKQSGIWTVASATANNAELTIKKLDSNKCVYLKRVTNNATLYRTITSPNESGALLEFEWDFRQETASDDMRAEILRHSSSPGKAVSIRTLEGAFYRWQKDNTWAKIADYETGKWYRFKVILNTNSNQTSSNGSYDVYINGVHMGTFECPQLSKSLAKYSIQFITNNNAGDFYIDNVKAYCGKLENCADNIIEEAEGVNVPYSKENFHIYLCIGQSNMAGRADIDEFEKNSANSDRVYLFTGLNEWKNAGCGERYGKVQGYNRYSTVEDKAKFNGTSPAHEFARYLTNADENIAVGIVSNAIGGTSIQKWQKNSPYGYYSQAVMRAKRAMEYGTLKGIILHQGEQNAQNFESYPKLLQQLVSDLRNDLGIDDLPIVVGKLYENDTNNAFNIMLEETASKIKNCGVVSVSDVTLNSDDIHYDTTSQRMVGARYGYEMKKLISDKVADEGYYAYEIQSGFENGKAFANASVINESTEAKDIYLIIASYSDNGMLLEGVDVVKKSIGSNLSREKFASSLESEKADEYIMYIWEDEKLYPVFTKTLEK